MDNQQTQPVKPMVIGSIMAMKLLSISRSTLEKWMRENRLRNLGLHKKKLTFSYNEVEQLARVPDKKK